MNLKQELLKIKINKLESDIEKHHCFSVSPVREIAELKGIKTNSSPTFELLRSYHCVHWESMGADVKDELLRTINKYLSPPENQPVKRSFWSKLFKRGLDNEDI